MAYINTDTMQYPISELDIRIENPLTSFGVLFIPPEKYVWVFPSPQPEYNRVISYPIEGTPTVGMGGYYQKWEIISKFTEYTDGNGVVITVSEQETVAIAADAIIQAEEQAKQNRLMAKLTRQTNVDSIVVTTAAGNSFDGDETSQNRMARAIIALQATGTPSTLWVLSDNTVTLASAAELSEALALAGAAQAAMWVIA